MSAIERINQPDQRNNDFLHRRVDMKNVLRIRCCRCDNEADRSLSSGAQSCDQAFAQKMFVNIKWRLGRKRDEDVCPDCIKKEKLARATAKAGAEGMGVVTLPKQSPESERSEPLRLSDLDRIMPRPADSLATAGDAFDIVRQSRHGDEAVAILDGEIEEGEKAGCLDASPPSTEMVESRDGGRVQRDQQALAALIKEQMVQTPEGLWRYVKGYSDQKMADALGVSVHSITHCRQKYIGLAHFKTPQQPPAPAPDALAEVQAQIAALHETIAAMTKRQHEMDTFLRHVVMPRVDELTEDMNMIGEPVTISPKSLLAMFNGHARVKMRPESAHLRGAR